jgi:hypothetical protein
MVKIIYRDGEPCEHTGCLNHVSHPCESCKRIAGRGIVYQSIDESNGEDMTSEVTLVKLPDGTIKIISIKYE